MMLFTVGQCVFNAELVKTGTMKYFPAKAVIRGAMFMSINKSPDVPIIMLNFAYITFGACFRLGETSAVYFGFERNIRRKADIII